MRLMRKDTGVYGTHCIASFYLLPFLYANNIYLIFKIKNQFLFRDVILININT